jgi:hypothetical protein
MRIAMGRRMPLLDGWCRGLTAVALACLAASVSPVAWSQPGTASAAVASRPEAGIRWSELTPAQRTALKPLERDWSTIDTDRKQKWVQIAGRMPSMPPAERERVQARMTEWTRLSPQQRGEARLAFEQAKQVSPQDRHAQWEAYQALPAEQRRQLQARAVPPARPPAASRPTSNGARTDKLQAKSNIVPNPAFAAPPKPIAPTVMQAQPGATTTLISKHATPPVHQQTGLPKIAATPEFVDKSTLLPRRGPQAAATRSTAASAPVQRP